MVARSFQKKKKKKRALETLFFIFFFPLLFISPPRIFMEGRGGRGVQWNVANLRANRRVFRMCSGSEIGEFRLVVQYERATKAATNLRTVLLTGLRDRRRRVIFFFFFFSLFCGNVYVYTREKKGGLKIFQRFFLSPVFLEMKNCN